MQMKRRPLSIDIFDYSGNLVCPLYHSGADISGQAADVFITTERNGWKVLDFVIPTTCLTENGQQKNFRLGFLKADYKIRTVQMIGGEQYIDWFIISEPKVTHNAFSQNCNVSAQHCAQILKYRKLNLEFSDKYGNNVGTAEQLLTTILEGTGWSVGKVSKFYEKDNVTQKVRSLVASTKTGAFKLISKMCQLFDAKPIYHGQGQTVDIIPINPFSQPQPGKLPDLSDSDGVIQLHYGKNVKDISRTLKTQNLVTRLYAYGSYGDTTKGYCGIEQIEHKEWTYLLRSPLSANTVYYFTFTDDEGIEVNYHFVPTDDISAGTKLVYSLFDPASMMYIWSEQKRKAYFVQRGTKGQPINCIPDIVQQKNWLASVMDYSYFKQIGLFSDDMLQQVATYQRDIIPYYEALYDASVKYSNAQTQLAKSIGSINFCKLAIDYVDMNSDSGYAEVHLDTQNYADGIIYRTDYALNKRDQFKFIPASKMVTTSESLFDLNGDPINSATSVLYILHNNTTPITWQKIYLRDVDDLDKPTILTLNAAVNSFPVDLTSDKYFLFEYNGINGYLGSYEALDESTVQALYNLTTVATVQHPVIFTEEDVLPYPNDKVRQEYGWLWKYDRSTYNPSDMYFCYGMQGDTQWKSVYFSDVQPPDMSYGYWYNWRSSILYKNSNGGWQKLETYSQKKAASYFGAVYSLCQTRDRAYKGIYDQYIYTVQTTLPSGNYYIDNGYGTYEIFSTNEDLRAQDTLSYDTKDGWVVQTKSGVQTPLRGKNYRFDSVEYHKENLWENPIVDSGGLNPSDGSIIETNNVCSSLRFINVYPNAKYVITGLTHATTLHFYDENKRWIKSMPLPEDGTFMTTVGQQQNECFYIKLVIDCSQQDFSDTPTVCAYKIHDVIIVDDSEYHKLSPIGVKNYDLSTRTPLKGIIPQLKIFYSLSDETYLQLRQKLLDAQAAITKLENDMVQTLGDLYREGSWQKDDYVEGDEQKLYDDAVDNIVKIAKPQAVYSVSYLDLYGSHYDDETYGVSIISHGIEWPDITTKTAVHLLDPQIDINVWAYVDKIKKCYDEPKKTSIEINTNLTTMTQHSFSDVLSHIAQVASDAKGKANVSMDGNALTNGSSIANGSITGIHIENESIPVEKIYAFEQQVNNLIDQKLSALKVTSGQISRQSITTAALDPQIDLSSNESIVLKVRNTIASDTPPKNPINNTLWLDTSGNVPVLKRWVNNEGKVDEYGQPLPSYWRQAVITQDQIGMLEDFTSTAQSQISQLQDSIQQRVTKTQYDSQVNKLRTSIGEATLTNDKFVVMFENTVSGDVDQRVNSVYNELDAYKNSVSNYLKFENGTLTLGQTGTSQDFRTQITNTKMAFMQGQTQVAHISNQQMSITDARITNALTIGSDNGEGQFSWVMTPMGLGLIHRRQE